MQIKKDFETPGKLIYSAVEKGVYSDPCTVIKKGEIYIPYSIYYVILCPGSGNTNINIALLESDGKEVRKCVCEDFKKRYIARINMDAGDEVTVKIAYTLGDEEPPYTSFYAVSVGGYLYLEVKKCVTCGKEIDGYSEYCATCRNILL